MQVSSRFSDSASRWLRRGATIRFTDGKSRYLSFMWDTYNTKAIMLLLEEDPKRRAQMAHEQFIV